ncbi:MAG: hypothetical protein AAF614_25585 [Chloroflexota bacterium]
MNQIGGRKRGMGRQRRGMGVKTVVSAGSSCPSGRGDFECLDNCTDASGNLCSVFCDDIKTVFGMSRLNKMFDCA